MAALTFPEELTSLNQWVGARIETIDGKETKVPVNIRTGGRASVSDPNTWCSYDEAVAALEKGDVPLIGFVFTADDPYTGIDIDKTGDFCTKEVARYQGVGYIETSVSGNGIHIIVRGTKVSYGCRGPRIEVYSDKRFFMRQPNRFARNQRPAGVVGSQRLGGAPTVSSKWRRKSHEP